MQHAEDPLLYGQRIEHEEQTIRWPDDARLAIWVVPNIEFYELEPPVNPLRASWPHPHPDVNGYSWRDYGNRVGQQRLIDTLDRHGVRGSVSLSTAVIEHHPELIEQCLQRDWELFSHGIYNTRYSYGMTEAQEREMICDAVAAIRATGQSCDGYLAPALTHSERTLDLFAEAGGIYTCDLFHDDRPRPVNVRAGSPFISMPYSMELNDFFAFIVNKQTPRQFVDMVKSSFDRLYAEGGQIMCLSLHAYLTGQPHRVHCLDELLGYIAGHGDVWLATGREIAHHYIENYYADDVANGALDVA
jgi:peptidoglycan/xylan/chitin deacetylase (PgdA/CDA1 family)